MGFACHLIRYALSVFRDNLEFIIDVLPYLLAVFSEGGGGLASLFGMPSYPPNQ